MPCMHKAPETEATTIGRRKRREQTINKRLMTELLSEPNDTSNSLEDMIEADIVHEDENYEEHQSQSSSTNTFQTKTVDRQGVGFLDVESSEAVIDELTNLK